MVSHTVFYPYFFSPFASVIAILLVLVLNKNSILYYF